MNYLVNCVANDHRENNSIAVYFVLVLGRVPCANILALYIIISEICTKRLVNSKVTIGFKNI